MAREQRPMKVMRVAYIADIPGRLFRNRNFIFALAFALGLSVGQGALWTKPLILPALALVMTLSTATISSRDLTSLKTLPRLVSLSLLLNYVILGSVILLLARWLIPDGELWAGFVVIAAVPPAVAVMPFTYLLAGDMVFSLVGLIGTYLLALALTPAVMMLLLGVDFLDPVKLLIMLVELIIIPLVVSRILLFTGLSQRIERWRGKAVNWAFFIVIFTIIGLNRRFFFGNFDILLRIAAIGIASTFVLGYGIELIAKALHVSKGTTVTLVLMGTLKNYGLASGIALTLLSTRASLPAAICSALFILYIVWLGIHLKKPT